MFTLEDKFGGECEDWFV